MRCHNKKIKIDTTLPSLEHTAKLDIILFLNPYNFKNKSK